MVSLLIFWSRHLSIHSDTAEKAVPFGSPAAVSNLFEYPCTKELQASPTLASHLQIVLGRCLQGLDRLWEDPGYPCFLPGLVINMKLLNANDVATSRLCRR